jgi:hypothetical protein
MGGSPGTEDPVLSVPVVQLSEILAHTDLPQRDAVELFNPGNATVDVGGWFLSDDRDEPRKFRIADGTRIPAGGYWVVDDLGLGERDWPQCHLSTYFYLPTKSPTRLGYW